jgi:hypothetical protein
MKTCLPWVRGSSTADVDKRTQATFITERPVEPIAGHMAPWAAAHAPPTVCEVWKYALVLATLGCTVLAGTLSTIIVVELGKSALGRLLTLLRALGYGLLLP